VVSPLNQYLITKLIFGGNKKSISADVFRMCDTSKKEVRDTITGQV
jgi:hypothetical protein